MAPPLAAPRFHAALPRRLHPQKVPCWRRAARPNDEDYYLIDAPESIGDGFSFSGGKYADGPSKSDEWFAQGRMAGHHVQEDRGEELGNLVKRILRVHVCGSASNISLKAASGQEIV
ncbi:hypothetical protein E2562_007607 [Oryza meyeriana var. granulata]|uniref:Uncharacterized protein n=1 Tax=Oryza meyeriana var. granulata TaxID=110450 RepID=A0A6G1DVL9_9ORYZ|nr:hypothetical protein E2562_007607 [Oryza meyeriana var. granulata]